jgi:hypothetical protein
MSETSNAEITIDAVYKEIEIWRAKKKSQGQKMPNDLWKRIISLAKQFPDQTRLCRRLLITKAQLKTKLREIGDEFVFNDPVELCQIPKIQNAPNYKNVEDSFSALSTLVVEFCRADGCIMKIHTTTKSIQELINNFLGAANVTNNCKA